MWKYERGGRGWHEPDPLTDPLESLPTASIPAVVAPLVPPPSPPPPAPEPRYGLFQARPPTDAVPLASPGQRGGRPPQWMPDDSVGAITEALAGIAGAMARDFTQTRRYVADLTALVARLDSLMAERRADV